MDEIKSFSLRWHVFVKPDMAVIPRKKQPVIKHYTIISPTKRKQG